MNTNQLKKFAQEARKKLLEQVSAKLDYVLTSDTPELREKAALISTIKDEIKNQGKEQLIDKVAYTWFNRFVALRYLDVNDYQPVGVKIVSPLDGQISPQILQDAIAGHIPEDLTTNKKKVFDLLDGKIESKNAENDAYRLLLIGACNYLNKIFPFLFERIDDYTELLLPDDLTSQFSIRHATVEEMLVEDCNDVECIGWLYQFYISERKDELINAKKKYKADEIAPVTQLFTPKWIVQYMVDNTLGQYWKDARPDSNIAETLEYYIKPDISIAGSKRNLTSPEEIKFFDPCVGSGHILCYAFDVFYKMYEEEGYNNNEISKLIITKNLHGIDIDERAGQLAGFALMIKGRQHDRRFFSKNITPNVVAFQNVEVHEQFRNAKILGSLIKISKSETASIEVDNNSLFAEREHHFKRQASLLAEEYDVVVTNPPYINSSYMEDSLKQFVEREYGAAKSDLFASFLLRAISLTKKDGLIGFVCPYVWMFIQSYEKLRLLVLQNTTLTSLIQLEYNAFGPAVVPICTFTLKNTVLQNFKGSYIKLSAFKGVESQAPRTKEAISNNRCGWFFINNQERYKEIPGSPIAYWLSSEMLEPFKNGLTIEEIGYTRKGMVCGGISRFGRLWHEVSFLDIAMDIGSRQEALESKKKWFPYNKGGEFCKWYGNQDYVINWENDGYSIRNTKHPTADRMVSSNYNLEFIFKPNLSWSDLSSSFFGIRYYPKGFLFDTSGPSLFLNDVDDLYVILAYLGSKLAFEYLQTLNPTMHFLAGNVASLPLKKELLKRKELAILAQNCVAIAKEDWEMDEKSFDFKGNNLLLKHASDTVEDSVEYFETYWLKKINEVYNHEVEINAIVNNIYKLDSLNEGNDLSNVVILKDYVQDKTLINNRSVKVEFDRNKIVKSFISETVGYMFGRYSLDMHGLVIASHGETIEDYFAKISKLREESKFVPDADNVIPILNDEWFEDDIVSKFNQFLIASFGEKNFRMNLSYLEEQIGMSLRKYFVKDFYSDHIQRFKKRPIYWMFSSAKGHFNVLIYIHRYTQDTLSNILNSYLREFIEKLKIKKEQLKHLETSGSSSEKTKAAKDIEKINLMLADCHDYERNILYPLATERIKVDLNIGVLINYNLFGKAVKEVKGLNDAKTKAELKNIDWIDSNSIR